MLSIDASLPPRTAAGDGTRGRRGRNTGVLPRDEGALAAVAQPDGSLHARGDATGARRTGAIGARVRDVAPTRDRPAAPSAPGRRSWPVSPDGTAWLSCSCARRSFARVSAVAVNADLVAIRCERGHDGSSWSRRRHGPLRGRVWQWRVRVRCGVTISICDAAVVPERIGRIDRSPAASAPCVSTTERPAAGTGARSALRHRSSSQARRRGQQLSMVVFRQVWRVTGGARS